jgi:hypothetical protein
MNVWKMALALVVVAAAVWLIKLGGAKTTASVDADKALLAAAPVYPGAVLVREYLRTEGGTVWRGREYATELAPAEAAATLNQYFDEKLAAGGYRTLESKPEVLSYRRADDRVTLTHIGPELPAPSGKRVVTDKPAPAGARFFYAVEVSSGG